MQVTVSWPSHNITENQARTTCRSITVNKTVIGAACFANNIGNGTSADEIVQACVSDVQVLLFVFSLSF